MVSFGAGSRKKFRGYIVLPLIMIGLFALSLHSCEFFPDSGEPGLGSPMEADDYGSIDTILGRGYDVFDFYADPEYVRSPIFDFDRLKAANMIEKTQIDRTEAKTISGSSSSSYQKDMGTTASLSGEYKFFSGSVSGAFSSSTISETSNQYATVHVRNRKAMYAIKNRTTPNSDYFKQYLTDDFKSALNGTIAPDALFTTYGTHVMTAIILGARYDYNLAAKQNTGYASTSMEAHAEAKFANLFSSASASLGYTENATSLSAFSETESSVITVGGNSALAAKTDTGLSDWLNSITDENARFSDYAADGLRPIWDFCDTAARRDEIQTAYSTWSTTKFSHYINTTVPKGTVKFTLNSLYNHNVGDSNGSAEWLWKFQIKSNLDGTTHTLTTVTNPDNSVSIGKAVSHSLKNIPYSFVVPISGSNTFQLLPMLEEDDNGFLGTSNTNNHPNDLFCTSTSGPRFNFGIEGQKLIFQSISDDSTKQSKGYFSLDSGGQSNDDMSLSLGQSKTFYLVLKQFNGTNSGEWVQWVMNVSWSANAN